LLDSIGVFADEKMNEGEINTIFDEHKSKVQCPECGKKNFSEAKKFNLLVKANLGNFTSDWTKDPAYLRGETCQGIYLNYKNVVDTTRVKIPFGIAQIGKAFRNEITARQFIFRTREFEQMEMQYFTHPDEEMSSYDDLRERRMRFWREAIGIKEDNLRWHKHENLVFYAKAAYDVEYKFPWGFDELEGVHARSDYDLTQHSKFSGKDLMYSDPKTQEKYTPHIIESSAGVGRAVFAVLSDVYTKEKLEDGSERIVMKFPVQLAPVKIAIFPLLKNKPELVAKAKKIFDVLKNEYMCEFDDNGNIGKRYRRQDEIGTPFCITVDFDTIEKEVVTIRDRDTMKQQGIATSALQDFFHNKI
jgi:glycyl-tRNA synthetase